MLRLGFLLAAAFGLAAVAAQEPPIRTADITLRGLKPSDFPRLTTLAPNVYAYEQIDPTKRTITANNLIVVTSDGVLVADGQGTVANVARLVSDIAKFTPQPIRYVVVGSTTAIIAAAIPPFRRAPPSSRIRTRRPTFGARRRVSVPAAPGSSCRLKPLPTSACWCWEAPEIQVLFLGRAHTGGDLEVYLPRERVLYISEVFSNRVFPSMANGFPTEWLATLERAEQLPADVLVPAHGFVDSPAVLKEEERNYHRALELIVAEGTRLHDAKVPLDTATASANFGVFDGWTRAANNAFQALKRVYAERDGQLP